MLVLRAYGVRCDTLDHCEVELDKKRAKDKAEFFDRFYQKCGPHRVVTMASVNDIVAGLRGAMKRHGCVFKRCDVCKWSARLIVSLWRT